MKLEQVVAYVQGGNRLGKPEACPEDVYATMLGCWAAVPEDRSTFSDLCISLDPNTPTKSAYPDRFVTGDGGVPDPDSAAEKKSETNAADPQPQRVKTRNVGVVFNAAPRGDTGKRSKVAASAKEDAKVDAKADANEESIDEVHAELSLLFDESAGNPDIDPAESEMHNARCTAAEALHLKRIAGALSPTAGGTDDGGAWNPEAARTHRAEIMLSKGAVGTGSPSSNGTAIGLPLKQPKRNQVAPAVETAGLPNGPPQPPGFGTLLKNVLGGELLD